MASQLIQRRRKLVPQLRPFPQHIVKMNSCPFARNRDVFFQRRHLMGNGRIVAFGLQLNLRVYNLACLVADANLYQQPLCAHVGVNLHRFKPHRIARRDFQPSRQPVPVALGMVRHAVRV